MTYITITKRAFWIMKGIILCLLFVLAGSGIYFYGEHVKRQCYLSDRKDFIEQYRAVQWELAGLTYCYEPRGGLLREAVYEGKNLYRVK